MHQNTINKNSALTGLTVCRRVQVTPELLPSGQADKRYFPTNTKQQSTTLPICGVTSIIVYGQEN